MSKWRLTVIADPDGSGRPRPVRPGGCIVLPGDGTMPTVEIAIDPEPPAGSTLRLRIEVEGLTLASSEVPCVARLEHQPLPRLLDPTPGQSATLVVELQAGWQPVADARVDLRAAPFLLCGDLDPPDHLAADGPVPPPLAEAFTAAGVRPGDDARQAGWLAWPGGGIALPAASTAGRSVSDAFARGRLAVSPPCVDWRGNHYPHGRLVYAEPAGEVPEWFDLLARQRLQWPPVAVDLSWLPSGRLDEAVRFVPNPEPPGFAVMLPSAALARRILDELAESGHDVDRWRAAAEAPDQRAIEDGQRELRSRLSLELGLTGGSGRFIPVPHLLVEGRSAWPNLVNAVVAGRHILLPDPRGPRLHGRDAIAEPVLMRLRELGLTAHLIDGLSAARAGVSVVRRPRAEEWWVLGEPAAAARLERGPRGAEHLQQWLAARADGAWEQSEQIAITSTDAPGWSVRIPLRRSRLQAADVPRQGWHAGSLEWAEWWIADGEFGARCGPSMLSFVLERFGRLVEEG